MPEPGDGVPILILTGPPGVGKTTTAEAVAKRSTRAVHLESDAFFHFIRSGYVEPWTKESHEQNQVMRVVTGGGGDHRTDQCPGGTRSPTARLSDSRAGRK